MYLTEEQRQTICDSIQDSLRRATLKNYATEEGDSIPLVDFLSDGNVISMGIEEIDYLVEQVYFDLSAVKTTKIRRKSSITDSFIIQRANDKTLFHESSKGDSTMYVNLNRYMVLPLETPIEDIKKIIDEFRTDERFTFDLDEKIKSAKEDKGLNDVCRGIVERENSPEATKKKK